MHFRLLFSNSAFVSLTYFNIQISYINISTYGLFAVQKLCPENLRKPRLLCVSHRVFSCKTVILCYPHGIGSRIPSTPWQPNSLETKLCGCSIPYRKWHCCAYNLNKASCILKIISLLLYYLKHCKCCGKSCKYNVSAT